MAGVFKLGYFPRDLRVLSFSEYISRSSASIWTLSQDIFSLLPSFLSQQPYSSLPTKRIALSLQNLTIFHIPGGKTSSAPHYWNG